MSTTRSILSGTGCALIDYLFTDINFDSPPFQRYISRTPGDGGLRPGHLVFVEGIERFSGLSYQDVLEEVTGGSRPFSSNLGGPSIVSLVHAAQLLAGRDVEVPFFGVRGSDTAGERIAEIIAGTPLCTDHYDVWDGTTPFTHVLSDPTWDDGAGERSFINGTGVAGRYATAHIPSSFYDHEIVAFGGTALVPALHDELHVPVRRARKGGSLTVVNTVYDFHNESRAPDRPWPLGESNETYRHTDLLVVDAEEARRLSGVESIEKSAQRFVEAGVSAVIITNGPDDLFVISTGGRFHRLEGQRFPTSRRVREELKSTPAARRDTTGCGDNFVGGVLYSLAEQISAGEKRLDMRHATAWGVASGGFACFSVGGTTIESYPGEKREQIIPYVRAYQRQLGGVVDDA